MKLQCWTSANAWDFLLWQITSQRELVWETGLYAIEDTIPRLRSTHLAKPLNSRRCPNAASCCKRSCFLDIICFTISFLAYPMVWYLVMLIFIFWPDGPATARLETESEHNVSFMIHPYALCQERIPIGISVTMHEPWDMMNWVNIERNWASEWAGNNQFFSRLALVVSLEVAFNDSFRRDDGVCDEYDTMCARRKRYNVRV